MNKDTALKYQFGESLNVSDIKYTEASKVEIKIKMINICTGMFSL